MLNFISPSLAKGYQNFELRFKVYKTQRDCDYPFSHGQIAILLPDLFNEISYKKAIEIYDNYGFEKAGAYALKIMLDSYESEFSDDYIFSALSMFLDILGQDLDYGKVKYSPYIQKYKSSVTFENEIAHLIKIHCKLL